MKAHILTILASAFALNVAPALAQSAKERMRESESKDIYCMTFGTVACNPSGANTSLNQNGRKEGPGDGQTRTNVKALLQSSEIIPPNGAEQRRTNALGDGRTGEGSKFSNAPTCPYLTKPLIRGDGGGLNRHASGSTVCHEGRTHVCEDGLWHVYAQCNLGLITAAEVESSAFDSNINNPPEEFEQPALKGNHPANSSLNRERDDVRQLNQEFNQLRNSNDISQENSRRNMFNQRNDGNPGGYSNPYSSTVAGGVNSERGNANECRSLQEAVSMAERNIKQVQDYYNATHTDRRTSPDVRQFVDIKNQALAEMRRLGC